MNDIPKIIFSRHGIKDDTEVDRTTRARADSNKDRVGGRQSVTPTAALPGPADLRLVSATSLGAGAVGVIYQPP